ncbi:MAG: ATP-binding cassette domain-containing protein [Tissierellia bacterium]|nr:ATP-binding cassette domain-containing protein [Tissierellia bacterium]
MEREPLIQVKNLDITFGEKKKKFHAVKQATFNIYPGETFGLVGESGSGKTTIGRSILGIVPTAGGDIIYKGRKINKKLNKKDEEMVTKEIQMIFQDPQASLNERAKVNYIVSEGLLNIEKNISNEERTKRVHEALLNVGLLPEFAGRFPHEFSGGQRQRIGIARALIMEPEFIIADEPISALDVSIRAQVINLLQKIQKERDMTYLFIAHDLSVMEFICDRIAVIYKGRIVELAKTEELMKNPIHPYTKSLLSAIPYPDPQYERNKKLIVYDPEAHPYETQGPTWRELKEGHYIYANDEEIKRYQEELVD